MGHMTMCLFNLFTAFGERWISQSLLKSLYFQKNGMTDYDSRWSCCVVSLRHLELMQLHRPELKVGQGTERNQVFCAISVLLCIGSSVDNSDFLVRETGSWM